ncbi:hypothetical protein BV898_00999 [Hypsibius exemplaris]|uniref:Secreted protein n=1 Tax=Hypsibius exemplaris TaxID=2072580 RepID=A0A1W0XCW1_HYPEX|nr:hypothetical protein BV898_00999 [Hypsibius exemplaris]
MAFRLNVVFSVLRVAARTTLEVAQGECNRITNPVIVPRTAYRLIILGNCIFDKYTGQNRRRGDRGLRHFKRIKAYFPLIFKTFADQHHFFQLVRPQSGTALNPGKGEWLLNGRRKYCDFLEVVAEENPSLKGKSFQ